MRIIVAFVAVALGCAFIAQGQNREKVTDTVKKPPAAAGAAAQATQKPADTAKKPAGTAKPADTAKSAATKPVAPAAPVESPDEKAIKASAEAFTKLYNDHDAKGLAALFSPNAEMIDEDGLVTKGRDAILTEFEKVFKETPKASMVVDIESVRVLTSNLGIEEGTARSKDSPDDSEDITNYVAIHVKTDGKWLLACVRDWDVPADELPPHDRLELDMSWLIGDWIDESPDAVVHTVCKWHDNGNFLMQEFVVQVAGEIAMSGTMRIGWDAVHKQFRSWVFDSHGGYSEGLWLRDGDDWVVKMQGATATGETASSTNMYRRIDDGTIAWQSVDRVVDGDRQDDIAPIVVKRKPPQPAE
jgi:uncharacterized protein (TIGR02246 family)